MQLVVKLYWSHEIRAFKEMRVVCVLKWASGLHTSWQACSVVGDLRPAFSLVSEHEGKSLKCKKGRSLKLLRLIFEQRKETVTFS